MTSFLLDNPLFLIFLVVAVGYPLGRVRVQGSSLGVAAVLFAGLIIGALDKRLELPTILYQLGLVLFVYTIGLANGRLFFASFRRQGLRDSGLAIGVIALAAAISALAHVVLDLKPTLTVGMFSGGLTNTPSLAAELEYLKAYAPAATLDASLKEPVVGYSVAYPFGVLGVILAIALAQRLWRIDYKAEAARVTDPETAPKMLTNQAILVTRPEATRNTLHDLIEAHGWNVVFGRIRQGAKLTLATGDARFAEGDIVSVIGPEEEIARVVDGLGERVATRLEMDRSQLDFRRIFVSSPAAVGHRLRDLHLPQRFDSVITRVRRGDVEFLPRGDTVLQAGDRVRVIAPQTEMAALTRFFGDSYRAVSEVDVPTFSLGLALGLLLGALPIPIPGGVDIKLGLAGGPLIVALVLGALDRTGPFSWGLPYSANMTLRQIGLVLFLAGIGTGAGYTFFSTVREGDGIKLLAGGAAVTFVSALLTLGIAYKLLKIPMGLVVGMVAGIHTQPAALGFALEQTGDELPNAGYAAVFPIATIAKIVIAQLLLAFLM